MINNISLHSDYKHIEFMFRINNNYDVNIISLMFVPIGENEYQYMMKLWGFNNYASLNDHLFSAIDFIKHPDDDYHRMIIEDIDNV